MTYDLNITFDDNLVTGNETIDTQHKELIDRIQNFVTACQNGDSKVKAIKIYRGLSRLQMRDWSQIAP